MKNCFFGSWEGDYLDFQDSNLIASIWTLENNIGLNGRAD